MWIAATDIGTFRTLFPSNIEHIIALLYLEVGFLFDIHKWAIPSGIVNVAFTSLAPYKL